MLIFLFIVTLIIGIMMWLTPEIKRRTRLAPVGILFLSFIFLIASMVRLVGPGQVGVVVLFGRVKEKTLMSGIHLINPFASIEKMSVRTESYTMSGKAREGIIRGDDAISALTSEGLTVKLDVTVWYRLKSEGAALVYRDIGPNYVEKIVRPAIKTVIRNMIAGYEVADIYTERREEIGISIEQGLKRALTGRNIEVEKVLMRNVQLPEMVQEKIDEKMASKQEAERMVFILQKESREVERKKLEAEGISAANRIISKSLSSSYLQWYYIKTLQQLVNSPNNTVIITPFDQKLTPLLNIPTGGQK
ncbi:MAG: prohibitin family protein [Candidatus Stahlbacteria bacterium]|nr:MAG: prohibitin family protein [Candidatus Stahlbacteria bacterium]